MLAYHYGRSDDKEKTLEYLDLASSKATRLYALEDAIGYFEAVMNLLDSLPDSADHRLLRISMLVKNQTTFYLLNKTLNYYELLLKYESMAINLDNPRLLGGFYGRKGFSEWQLGHLDQALENSEKAITLCEARDNAVDAGYAYMTCQWVHMLKGNFEAVLALKEKALGAYQKAFSLHGYVYSICAVSLTYSFMGQWDAAVKEGERALKVAEEHSDASLASFATCSLCDAFNTRGDMAKALEVAQQAVEKASSPTDYLWSYVFLGWTLCRSGELEKGLDYLAGAVQEFRKASADVTLVTFGGMLGEGYWRNRQFDKAMQELKEKLKLAEKSGLKFHAAWCHSLLGGVSLEADPAQEKTPSAEACFETAIAISRDIKAEYVLARAYAGLGRCYGKKGNVAAARDYLNRALEILERLDILLEPDKVRADLAQLPEA